MSTSPLVGRTEQLAVLRDAAARAWRGQPAVVLVQGEAGIGKTRLVGELLECLPSSCAVARGNCSHAAGRMLPFAPWRQVLRSLGGMVDPAVSGLLATTWDPSQATALSTSRLHGEITDAVVVSARHDPLVVVIEDVHWADDPSRDVVDYLARTVRDERLMLVVTARTDDPGYPAVRPLAEELRRLRQTVAVDLQRLTPAQVQELANGLGAQHWMPEQLAGLISRSEGVPYFVEELVRLGIDTDNVPADLADRAVGHRLTGLSRSTRQLVRLAALAFADPLDQLLAGAAGMDPVAYEAAVAEAIDRGILYVDKSRGRYRFRHALLREATLASLAPPQRARLHRMWGQAWKEQPDTFEGRTAALAHHWLEADDERALRACLAAADQAGALSAYRERLRLLAVAAERWPRTPVGRRPGDRNLADLHLEAADTARMIGDAAAARSHLEAARPELDPRDEVRLAWVDLGGLWLDSVHNVPHPGDDYLALLARIPRDPPDPRRKDACDWIALRLCLVGRYEDAVACATEAIQLAEALGDGDDVTRFRTRLAEILALSGAHDEARGIMEDLLGRLSDDTALAVASDILGSAAFVAWLAGDSAGSLRDGSSHVRLLGGDEPGALPDEWAMEMVNQADLLMELGRWDDADSHLERVARAELLTPRVSGYAERLCIHLGAWRGTLDLDGFRDHWADRQVGDWSVLPDLQDVLPHLFSIIDTFAYADIYDRVRETLLGVLEERIMARAPLPYLLPVLASVGREEADRAERCGADETAHRLAARARELLDERPPGSDRDAAFVALANAELLRWAGRDDGEAWRTAVARWRPAGMPLWLARSLFGQVRGSNDEQRAMATGALDEAARIARQLGARPLLESIQNLARRKRLRLASPDDAPNPWALTERELEVLRWISGGATNSAIARELVISEKTVSVHVSHVLAKMNATNRTTAADLARRAGAIPDQPSKSRQPG